MITGLKGKITDETTLGVPSATVFVSDKNGVLKTEQARVKSNLSGEYQLPVSAPIVDPFTGKLKMIKLGTHLTVKVSGLPDKIVEIDFTGSGIKNLDISILPKTQMLPEVVITADRDKFLCEKQGGTYDEKTKSCKLPEIKQKPKTMKEKWNSLSKTKKTVIIAAGSVAVLGLIVLIVKATK
jgi:hypothetical protein